MILRKKGGVGGEAPPKRGGGLGAKLPSLGCFCAYIAANEKQTSLNLFFSQVFAYLCDV